jgi:hypothetical protein
MKKSIKSLLILTLLMIGINQLSANWFNTCETLNNEDSKKYSIINCTKSNYYSFLKDNFFYVKNEE